MAKGAFRIFIGLGVAGLLSSCTWIYGSLRRTEFGRSPSLPEASGPLQLSHSTWVADPGQPLKLTASGVAGTSSFSLVSGPGSIDPFSGLFTPGKIFGTSVVRITDQLGRTAQANITQIPTWLWANGPVNAFAFDGLGNMFVGGNFTQIGSQIPTVRLATLDTTTGMPRSDCDLQTGFNNTTSALLRTESAIYVGGSFTEYRGVGVQRLVKLDLNCQLDTQFSQSLGFDNNVTALAIDEASNSLYVGGDFTAYRGVANSALRLAKLNAQTGALDTQFTRANSGLDASVLVLAIHPDTQSLYVGGYFTQYRGVANSARYLAKLNLVNGDLDTNFTRSNSVFDSGVTTLAVNTENNSLYAGGWFTQYRGVANSARYLAKMDLVSGNLDTNFTRNNSGFSWMVQSIALSKENQSLYVGGYFGSYRGVSLNGSYIVKLDLNSGDLDAAFGSTLFMVNGRASSGRSPSFNSIVVHPQSNSLYVGGDFTSYRGVPYSVRNIAKLHLQTGELDTSFNPNGSGVNGSVSALALDSRGESVLLAGSFSSFARANNAVNLAKLSLSTGLVDPVFTRKNSGFIYDPNSAFGSEVLALAVHLPNNSLYVGGKFRTYRGVENSAYHLAKVDLTTGDLDTVFTRQGSGFDGSLERVEALAIHAANNSLYVGGSFSGYRGDDVSVGIAKLDLETGDRDMAYRPGVSFIYSMAIHAPTNSLYVAGLSSPVVRKLDLTTGAFDTVFGAGGGLDIGGADVGITYGRAIVLHPASNSVYVAGYFRQYRGVANSARNLAKLDMTSGNLDTNFTKPNNGFNSHGRTLLLHSPSSSLIVGGYFTQYRGQAASGLAKVHLTTGDLDTNFTRSQNAATPEALAWSSDESALYIGGNFDFYRNDRTLGGRSIIRVDISTGDPK